MPLARGVPVSDGITFLGIPLVSFHVRWIALLARESSCKFRCTLPVVPFGHQPPPLPCTCLEVSYSGFDEVYGLWALSSASKGGLEWSSQQIGQVGPAKYSSYSRRIWHESRRLQRQACQLPSTVGGHANFLAFPGLLT